MDPDEDVQLMLRWQAGDGSVFDVLVEKYQKRVMAVAYRMLLSRADAEDVAQETFLRLYRSKDHYRPTAKFTSYLFTIVRRLCLNSLRKRRRHPETPLLPEEDFAGTSGPVPWADFKSPLPSQVLESQERSELIRKAMSRLSLDERTALVLDHWEEQPLDAIGRIMYKSIPAVKSLLFRARAKLRKFLAADMLELSGR